MQCRNYIRCPYEDEEDVRCNTVEGVLCLCTGRSYTVFFKNCDESNMLSDIVVEYPLSIQIMKTWSYVLIIDTTHKQTSEFYYDIC